MTGEKAIRWAAICVAALVALFLLIAGANHVLGYVPLTPQWSAKRAEARAKALATRVTTLEAEAAGNAEIAQATETYHTREVVIREAAAQAINEARNAPDADTPLSPERADRLRAHDRVLCERTGLCAPADPA